MSIYLIRHGLTQYNLEHRTMGKTDIPLCKNGINEIKNNIQYKDLDTAEIIITSPLKRALETSELINKKIHAKIIVDERLTEFDYGDWEGLTTDEIKGKYRDEFDFYMAHPEKYISSNGKSLKDKREEVGYFISEREELFRNKSCVIVSHAMTLKLLLSFTDKIELCNIWKIGAIRNGDIIKREIS